MVNLDKQYLSDIMEHYKTRNQKLGEQAENAMQRMKLLETALPTLVIWDKWKQSKERPKIDVEDLIQTQIELRQSTKSRCVQNIIAETINPEASKSYQVQASTYAGTDRIQNIRKLQECIAKEKLIKEKITELEKKEASYKVILENLAHNSLGQNNLQVFNAFQDQIKPIEETKKPCVATECPACPTNEPCQSLKSSNLSAANNDNQSWLVREIPTTSTQSCADNCQSYQLRKTEPTSDPRSGYFCLDKSTEYIKRVSVDRSPPKSAVSFNLVSKISSDCRIEDAEKFQRECTSILSRPSPLQADRKKSISFHLGAKSTTCSRPCESQTKSIWIGASFSPIDCSETRSIRPDQQALTQAIPQNPSNSLPPASKSSKLYWDNTQTSELPQAQTKPNYPAWSNETVPSDDDKWNTPEPTFSKIDSSDQDQKPLSHCFCKNPSTHKNLNSIGIQKDFDQPVTPNVNELLAPSMNAASSVYLPGLSEPSQSLPTPKKKRKSSVGKGKKKKSKPKARKAGSGKRNVVLQKVATLPYHETLKKKASQILAKKNLSSGNLKSGSHIELYHLPAEDPGKEAPTIMVSGSKADFKKLPREFELVGKSEKYSEIVESATRSGIPLYQLAPGSSPKKSDPERTLSRTGSRKSLAPTPTSETELRPKSSLKKLQPDTAMPITKHGLSTESKLQFNLDPDEPTYKNTPTARPLTIENLDSVWVNPNTEEKPTPKIQEPTTILEPRPQKATWSNTIDGEELRQILTEIKQERLKMGQSLHVDDPSNIVISIANPEAIKSTTKICVQIGDKKIPIYPQLDSPISTVNPSRITYCSNEPPLLKNCEPCTCSQSSEDDGPSTKFQSPVRILSATLPTETPDVYLQSPRLESPTRQVIFKNPLLGDSQLSKHGNIAPIFTQVKAISRSSSPMQNPSRNLALIDQLVNSQTKDLVKEKPSPKTPTPSWNNMEFLTKLPSVFSSGVKGAPTKESVSSGSKIGKGSSQKKVLSKTSKTERSRSREKSEKQTKKKSTKSNVSSKETSKLKTSSHKGSSSRRKEIQVMTCPEICTTAPTLTHVLTKTVSVQAVPSLCVTKPRTTDNYLSVRKDSRGGSVPKPFDVHLFEKAILEGSEDDRRHTFLLLAKNLCGAVADIFGQFSKYDSQLVKTFMDISMLAQQANEKNSSEIPQSIQSKSYRSRKSERTINESYHELELPNDNPEEGDKKEKDCDEDSQKGKRVKGNSGGKKEKSSDEDSQVGKCLCNKILATQLNEAQEVQTNTSFDFDRCRKVNKNPRKKNHGCKYLDPCGMNISYNFNDGCSWESKKSSDQQLSDWQSCKYDDPCGINYSEEKKEKSSWNFENQEDAKSNTIENTVKCRTCGDSVSRSSTSIGYFEHLRQKYACDEKCGQQKVVQKVVRIDENRCEINLQQETCVDIISLGCWSDVATQCEAMRLIAPPKRHLWTKQPSLEFEPCIGDEKSWTENLQRLTNKCPQKASCTNISWTVVKTQLETTKSKDSEKTEPCPKTSEYVCALDKWSIKNICKSESPAKSSFAFGKESSGCLPVVEEIKQTISVHSSKKISYRSNNSCSNSWNIPLQVRGPEDEDDFNLENCICDINKKSDTVPMVIKTKPTKPSTDLTCPKINYTSSWKVEEQPQKQVKKPCKVDSSDAWKIDKQDVDNESPIRKTTLKVTQPIEVSHTVENPCASREIKLPEKSPTHSWNLGKLEIQSQKRNEFGSEEACTCLNESRKESLDALLESCSMEVNINQCSSTKQLDNDSIIAGREGGEVDSCSELSIESIADGDLKKTKEGYTNSSSVQNESPCKKSWKFPFDLTKSSELQQVIDYCKTLDQTSDAKSQQSPPSQTESKFRDTSPCGKSWTLGGCTVRIADPLEKYRNEDQSCTKGQSKLGDICKEFEKQNSLLQKQPSHNDCTSSTSRKRDISKSFKSKEDSFKTLDCTKVKQSILPSKINKISCDSLNLDNLSEFLAKICAEDDSGSNVGNEIKECLCSKHSWLFDKSLQSSQGSGDGDQFDPKAAFMMPEIKCCHSAALALIQQAVSLVEHRSRQGNVSKKSSRVTNFDEICNNLKKILLEVPSTPSHVECMCRVCKCSPCTGTFKPPTLPEGKCGKENLLSTLAKDIPCSDSDYNESIRPRVSTQKQASYSGTKSLEIKDPSRTSRNPNIDQIIEALQERDLLKPCYCGTETKQTCSEKPTTGSKKSIRKDAERKNCDKERWNKALRDFFYSKNDGGLPKQESTSSKKACQCKGSLCDDINVNKDPLKHPDDDQFKPCHCSSAFKSMKESKSSRSRSSARKLGDSYNCGCQSNSVPMMKPKYCDCEDPSIRTKEELGKRIKLLSSDQGGIEVNPKPSQKEHRNTIDPHKSYKSCNCIPIEPKSTSRSSSRKRPKKQSQCECFLTNQEEDCNCPLPCNPNCLKLIKFFEQFKTIPSVQSRTSKTQPMSALAIQDCDCNDPCRCRPNCSLKHFERSSVSRTSRKSIRIETKNKIIDDCDCFEPCICEPICPSRTSRYEQKQSEIEVCTCSEPSIEESEDSCGLGICDCRRPCDCKPKCYFNICEPPPQEDSTEESKNDTDIPCNCCVCNPCNRRISEIQSAVPKVTEETLVTKPSRMVPCVSDAPDNRITDLNDECNCEEDKCICEKEDVIPKEEEEQIKETFSKDECNCGDPCICEKEVEKELPRVLDLNEDCNCGEPCVCEKQDTEEPSTQENQVIEEPPKKELDECNCGETCVCEKDNVIRVSTSKDECNCEPCICEKSDSKSVILESTQPKVSTSKDECYCGEVCICETPEKPKTTDSKDECNCGDNCICEKKSTEKADDPQPKKLETSEDCNCIETCLCENFRIETSSSKDDCKCEEPCICEKPAKVSIHEVETIQSPVSVPDDECDCVQPCTCEKDTKSLDVCGCKVPCPCSLCYKKEIDKLDKDYCRCAPICNCNPCKWNLRLTVTEKTEEVSERKRDCSCCSKCPCKLKSSGHCSKTGSFKTSDKPEKQSSEDLSNQDPAEDFPKSTSEYAPPKNSEEETTKDLSNEKPAEDLPICTSENVPPKTSEEQTNKDLCNQKPAEDFPTCTSEDVPQTKPAEDFPKRTSTLPVETGPKESPSTSHISFKPCECSKSKQVSPNQSDDTKPKIALPNCSICKRDYANCCCTNIQFQDWASKQSKPCGSIPKCPWLTHFCKCECFGGCCCSQTDWFRSHNIDIKPRDNPSKRSCQCSKSDENKESSVVQQRSEDSKDTEQKSSNQVVIQMMNLPTFQGCNTRTSKKDSENVNILKLSWSKTRDTQDKLSQNLEEVNQRFTNKTVVTIKSPDLCSTCKSSCQSCISRTGESKLQKETRAVLENINENQPKPYYTVPVVPKETKLHSSRLSKSKILVDRCDPHSDFYKRMSLTSLSSKSSSRRTSRDSTKRTSIKPVIADPPKTINEVKAPNRKKSKASSDVTNTTTWTNFCHNCCCDQCVATKHLKYNSVSDHGNTNIDLIFCRTFCQNCQCFQCQFKEISRDYSQDSVAKFNKNGPKTTEVPENRKSDRGIVNTSKKTSMEDQILKARNSIGVPLKNEGPTSKKRLSVPPNSPKFIPQPVVKNSSPETCKTTPVSNVNDCQCHSVCLCEECPKLPARKSVITIDVRETGKSSTPGGLSVVGCPEVKVDVGKNQAEVVASCHCIRETDSSYYFDLECDISMDCLKKPVELEMEHKFNPKNNGK